MSSVKVSGSATGTANFTIIAPSGTSTDRTLTLPDEAGTVLTSASDIAGQAGGITHFDAWRLSAGVSVSSGVTDITSANWEQVDSSDPALKGAGMSVSSGIFTFPVTGLWRIDFIGNYDSFSAAASYAGFRLYATLDGSSYGIAAEGWGNTYSATSNVAVPVTHYFDVTDTSTHKIKFTCELSTSCNLAGATGQTRTGAFFTRLGDT